MMKLILLNKRELQVSFWLFRQIINVVGNLNQGRVKKYKNVSGVTNLSGLQKSDKSGYNNYWVSELTWMLPVLKSF